jgi:hypothetical protein
MLVCAGSFATRPTCSVSVPSEGARMQYNGLTFAIGIVILALATLLLWVFAI